MNPDLRLVVPMKPLDDCKQRLAGVMDEVRRRQLVLWMLRRVLTAAIMSAVGPVWVVGGGKEGKLLASVVGAEWRRDASHGLNAILAAEHTRATSDRFEGILFLPGDLPFLEADDVVSLARAFEGANAVLAPGRRGGTNAIIAPTAGRFDFLMGEGSFARHVEALDRNGTPWRSVDSPSLAADIDLPEDLELLEQQVPRFWGQLADIPRLFGPLPETPITNFVRD
ncbi:MAG: 2-phospho-L-lactate guanylyltransferase [Dehalococcoidia bacterium]|nr:2-phospho-L-lactate guanylyltransferase [Dehalococcoidia bacterium]